MKKSHKLMLYGSISLNVILIISFLIGYNVMKVGNENIFLTNAQDQLVLVESRIGVQEENNWENPEDVTVLIRDIVVALDIGINNGGQLNILSEDELESLEEFADKLYEFTFDNTEEFMPLTDSDKEAYLKLHDSLNEVGLKTDTQRSKNWDTFVKQIRTLNESIEPPSIR